MAMYATKEDVMNMLISAPYLKAGSDLLCSIYENIKDEHIRNTVLLALASDFIHDIDPELREIFLANYERLHNEVEEECSKK